MSQLYCGQGRSPWRTSGLGPGLWTPLKNKLSKPFITACNTLPLPTINVSLLGKATSSGLRVRPASRPPFAAPVLSPRPTEVRRPILRRPHERCKVPSALGRPCLQLL